MSKEILQEAWLVLNDIDARVLAPGQATAVGVVRNKIAAALTPEPPPVVKKAVKKPSKQTPKKVVKKRAKKKVSKKR